MKMRSRSVYDPARPARDEGRYPLEHKARYKVWPGHRSEPQIVASLRREHAEQSVSPFDVLRRREEGDEDGEHLLAVPVWMCIKSRSKPVCGESNRTVACIV